MDNLLLNSDWQMQTPNGPKYYSGFGPITYDSFAYNGNRTCSITMPNGMNAKDGYDPMISLRNGKFLVFGLTIRTIDITTLEYLVTFFDSNKNTITSMKMDVAQMVTSNFSPLNIRFPIPDNAQYASVEWMFFDQVTACSYCAPTAYIM